MESLFHFLLVYILIHTIWNGGLQSILVATALTATSIAISVRVLTDLGKMQTKEAKLILGATSVDDILAIAVLSVVTTMVQTGNMTPNLVDITLLILKILGILAYFAYWSNIHYTKNLTCRKVMEVGRQH